MITNLKKYFPMFKRLFLVITGLVFITFSLILWFNYENLYFTNVFLVITFIMLMALHFIFYQNTILEDIAAIQLTLILIIYINISMIFAPFMKQLQAMESLEFIMFFIRCFGYSLATLGLVIAIRTYLRKTGASISGTFQTSSFDPTDITKIILHNNKDRTSIIFAIDLMCKKNRIRLRAFTQQPLKLSAYETLVIELDQVVKYSDGYNLPSDLNPDKHTLECITDVGKIRIRKLSINNLLSSTPAIYAFRFPQEYRHEVNKNSEYVITLKRRFKDDDLITYFIGVNIHGSNFTLTHHKDKEIDTALIITSIVLTPTLLEQIQDQKDITNELEKIYQNLRTKQTSHYTRSILNEWIADFKKTSLTNE